MKFEEAMENLRDSKLLTRDEWKGKRIQLKNNHFYILNENFLLGVSTEKWDKNDEDILADDWKIVDQNDLKEFHLSINELKNLGVSQEAIDEFKKTLPLLGRLKGTEVIMDKDKLSLLSQAVPNSIVANFKPIDYSHLKNLNGK